MVADVTAMHSRPRHDWTLAEAERLFALLGEGGQVQMPMTQTFFSPRFGMVADRFGVSWMIIARPAAT